MEDVTKDLFHNCAIAAYAEAAAEGKQADSEHVKHIAYRNYEDELKAKHTMAVMSSSKDMTWPTPQQWFDYLNLEFDFTLDPCCVPETAKCAKFYTPADDGLSKSWAEERVFMNPPYGKEIGLWMKKAYEEARDNMALVVCFVPARVDTNWWHNYAAKATEIRFPKGRAKTDGAKVSYPFPISIIIFRPRL